ncbi:mitochondrial K -H exchange-related-domain-containing protein [Phanerochaete sordida]|uniref:Mitochondrial K -H exchange-related-domain-containing protein n=1 Tax=Phanerochaete sordida TaxID=48140 RepID=A0A9P3LC54_9APHY|nr:mitochondrial K -H exchange-related-domain-containing protein [Phanerochaete sordida]
MSAVPQLAKRSLRIVALPLVTASHTPESSSSGHLTYYHFATRPRKQDGKPGWAEWATHKAADLWAGFGKAPEGHWKRRTFLYGERLVDRIDFEELALKSLDPSLGPKLTRFGQSEADVKADSTLFWNA